MTGLRGLTVGMKQGWELLMKGFFPDAPNNQKEDSSEKMGAALESPIPMNVSACL